jgi:hypothetical protein
MKKHAAQEDAGTAHQSAANTSNWSGEAVPTKRSGTLAKRYFGMA